VVTVPASVVAGGAAPTAAEVQTFYTRNAARYTLPERRVIRYALVSPAAVEAQATPTEAEVAAAFNRDRARYAATEKRDVEQVVVLTQAGANAIAAKVRAGTALAVAAREAGLQTSNQAGVDKAAYATATSPAAADAVFGAAQGTLVGPVRGPGGFVVARVTRIEQVPARTLDQARPEITAALRRTKQTQALSTLADQVNDGLAGNATFDEVVADRKLAARTTPALTAAGTDPLDPAVKLDPALQPVVQAAFAAAEGDEPQLVTLGQDGSFAVVALGRVIAAAPRPLAEVRDQVARDFAADRALRAARQVAAAIVGKVNGGATLAAATAASGRGLPAPRAIAGQRADLVRGPRPGQEALPLLFGLKQGAARLAPLPDRSGYVVLRLDRVERGDAARNKLVLEGARADLGRLVGREYAEQFVRAARNTVGVTTDAAAIGRVRAELLGQTNN
jgi:peptidyl-prolyl cis-trans isomerase D